MKTKIALFASKKQLKELSVYIYDYRDLEIVPFIYHDASETYDLIEQAVMCDVYLFTGLLPYLYAKEKIDHKRLPAVYIDYDDYMMLSACYQVQYDDCRLLERFALDAPTSQPFTNLSDEQVSFAKDTTYPYFYGEQYEWGIDAIVAHHQTLWTEDKIDYVLTTSEEVARRLSVQNIPVITTKIPRTNMESALERARAIIGLSQLNSTQVVTGIIRLKQQSLTKDVKHPKQHEAYKTTLMAFVNRTDAALYDQEDKLIIVGTDTLLNYLKSHFRDFPILHKLTEKSEAPIDIGFGLGLTAKQAENLAELALRECANTPESSCYLVNDRKEAIGPLGVRRDIDTTHLYQTLIHQAKLSNDLSYNFIDFIKTRNNEPFSAHDVATYHRVTKRSAERTIYKLLSADVIKVVGEEKPYRKGRPRKLFKMAI